jgi:hypothetical protein
MIDNVMLLLKGTLSGRSASELMKQCHPLGFFKVGIIKPLPRRCPHLHASCPCCPTVLSMSPSDA